MAGRKPKPTALKKLEGNPGKRKLNVEADSGGVTEAGTTQRDIVREGVVQIGVTFRVSKKWLNKFSAYKKLTSITVGYLDTETMNFVTTQMYIDGYQEQLINLYLLQLQINVSFISLRYSFGVLPVFFLKMEQK